MAVSRTPGRERQSRTDAGRFVGPTRYDLALLGIPTLFCLALLGHLVLGVPLVTALLPASVAGVALVVDAVFLNPPTARQSGRS